MGVLRRRIDLAGREGEVRAVVEDNFHHFRVTLFHDGKTVSDIVGQALRNPWTRCPLAANRLPLLVGMALSTRPTAVMEQADPRLQCTHMFDLAGLALAAAARGTTRRIYEIAVPDHAGPVAEASLWRDGALILRWILDRTTITAPPPYTQMSLRKGFVDWVYARLDAEDAEAAIVLRRGVFVSGEGSRVDLDRFTRPIATGGCLVTQPEQAAQARRNVGASRDFSERAEALTLDDRQWLAFAA